MTGILWLARRALPGVILRGVRPLGKALPPGVLLALARPFAACAALAGLAYAGPTFGDFRRLPAPLRTSRLRLWREGTALRLAGLLVYWPDLLTTPRWSRLLRLEGSGPSRAILDAGARPVVLVSLHLGPYRMLYYGFRARGVPIAALTATAEERQPPHKRVLFRLCDRAAGLEGVPRFFLPGEMWGAAEFLRANRVLLVFATGGCGRHFEVGDEEVILPLSPGALKLAALVDAAVIPCVILAGRGATTISLGEPLEPADVSDRHRHREACEQMARFFLKAVRSAPGQCDPWLLDRLRGRAGAVESIGVEAGGD